MANPQENPYPPRKHRSKKNEIIIAAGALVLIFAIYGYNMIRVSNDAPDIALRQNPTTSPADTRPTDEPAKPNAPESAPPQPDEVPPPPPSPRCPTLS